MLEVEKFLILIIAVVTLIATIVLSIMGLSAASNVRSSFKKVEKIQENIDQAREHLFGSKIVAKMAFLSISDSLKFHDMTRRMIDRTVEILEQQQSSADELKNIRKTFSDYSEKALKKQPQIILIFEMLSCEDHELKAILSNFSQLCIHEDDDEVYGFSIEFLEAFSSMLESNMKSRVISVIKTIKYQRKIRLPKKLN